jgi:glyoxylate carboligase
MKISGGEALVKSLVKEGVEVVFGIPGIQLYGVVAALREEPSIRFVTTRHEQASTYMADGYARAPPANRASHWWFREPAYTMLLPEWLPHTRAPPQCS